MNTKLTGKLLIAMPSIGDERFARSVILICAHAPEFAMGIVLNKPMTGLTLPILLDQLDIPVRTGIPDTVVLDGGPVSNERGFVLHSNDVQREGSSLEIMDDVHMTATRDILVDIGSDSPPRKCVLALGYSGWGAGQLESELVENAWLVGTPDQDLVFGEDHNAKWSLALERMGVDSGRLQSDAGRA
jgi:putative transcriptional regulator